MQGCCVQGQFSNPIFLFLVPKSALKLFAPAEQGVVQCWDVRDNICPAHASAVSRCTQGLDQAASTMQLPDGSGNHSDIEQLLLIGSLIEAVTRKG